MKTIVVTNIEYNFNGKVVDPYTLPQDMIFIVEDTFNKYVEVSKLIHKNTSFFPKSYFIKEDNNIGKYINYEEIDNFINPPKDEYHSLHEH
jgi:hypothetical protein